MKHKTTRVSKRDICINIESDYADSISYSGGDGVCLTHESGDYEQEQLTLR